MPKRAQPKRKVPAARKPVSSTPDLKKEIAHLRREIERLEQQHTATVRQLQHDLTVAIEHQTATSEILSSITGSITNTQPLFDAIVRNLRRLFGTRIAMVQLLSDGLVHLVAAGDEAISEILTRQFPRPLDKDSGGGLAMLSKQVVQFAPVLANPITPPGIRARARELGFDSVIFAPMIREDKVIGAVGTARPSSEPFDDRQVALIKTFADQAVIAIENARLFEQVQARTKELTESLEQQTATSAVLSVISSSPGELDPVFGAILENATRICDARFGTLFRYDGEFFHRVASTGTPSALVEFQRQRGPFKLESASDWQTSLGQVVATKTTVHVADGSEDESEAQTPPVKLGGRVLSSPFQCSRTAALSARS